MNTRIASFPFPDLFYKTNYFSFLIFISFNFNYFHRMLKNYEVKYHDWTTGFRESVEQTNNRVYHHPFAC